VRPELPSGTVTFLFTDVEGSTALLHELGPDLYARALAEHRAVLRRAFAAHGGVEVDTQGDAFFVAFPTAPGALEAAAAALTGLVDGPIRVRIGIHSGTPIVGDEGYVGVDVHRAARIAAAGHGGQVLVSASTAALGGADGLRDLGEHRLKDLSAPERIYQLGDEDFPPLKSLYRTNIPVPATPFLGRDRELDDVRALLAREDVRLLTLTGPGGTGKTRLALQAAGEAAERFPDGIFWVALAPLRDPKLVLEAAAHAIGGRGRVAEQIADKTLLLLLDNFEHVVEAAAGVAELLAACPNLRLLVTSRELLRLPGEQAYPVPPLTPEDSIDLFLARARAARPSFAPTAGVPELCARLDNLPLALELAAARVGILAPEQLLERLSQRLDLLRAGRGVDARQQTLRATVEWSHGLLNDDEQRLFARLGVFQGGCMLEAAEEVCDADVDTLQSLADKSLVRALDSGRFLMLETIRDYALERLDGSGDAGSTKRRHAEYFLAFAQRAEPELDGEQQGVWLERLEQDYGNVRAAFAVPEVGLRLAGAIRMFWVKRGYPSDGRRLLAELLRHADDAEPAKPKALFTAALLAVMQGDWAEAERLATAAHELGLRSGDRTSAAESLIVLGRALLATGGESRAAELFEAAADLGSEVGRPTILAIARLNLGYLALQRGEFDRASADFQQASEHAAGIGDLHAQARALAGVGSSALQAGRIDDAVEALRASLRVSGPLGDKDNIVWALQLLGAANAHSDQSRAALLLGAAEALRTELGQSLHGLELRVHEQALSRLDLAVVGDDWAAGRALPLDRAVELALD
jgi:predicted ATPase/class 3 adenylate cyclase